MNILTTLLSLATSLDKKGHYDIADELDQIIRQSFSFNEEGSYNQEDVPSESINILPNAPSVGEVGHPIQPDDESAGQEGGEAIEPEEPSEVRELLQLLQDAGYDLSSLAN